MLCLWREQEAFADEAAQDVPDGNGADAAVFLFEGDEAAGTEGGGMGWGEEAFCAALDEFAQGLEEGEGCGASFADQLVKVLGAESRGARRGRFGEGEDCRSGKCGPVGVGVEGGREEGDVGRVDEGSGGVEGVEGGDDGGVRRVVETMRQEDVDRFAPCILCHECPDLLEKILRQGLGGPLAGVVGCAGAGGA